MGSMLSGSEERWGSGVSEFVGDNVGVLLESYWDVGRGTADGSVRASSPSSGVLGFLTDSGIGKKSCSSN